jgi:pimeloyl-ACP methyl ester carboxylesterase
LSAGETMSRRRCHVSKATANGIRIEYETSGDPSARPLLLIGGLADQLIHWDDDFCRDLTKLGHYVIRFDNRDAGLSTKFDEAGVPNLATLTGEEKGGPPYTLDDMADDAVGLLDALGIRKAHICGMSMGGMIAQIVAIRHPSRVLSLISICSTTGDKDLPPPQPEVRELLLAPAPREREAHIEYMLLLFKAMAGRGFAFDEEWSRMITARAYDRCFSPEGTARQIMAIMTQGNRKKALASVTAPTLVIHGTDDPVVPVEAGRDTANAIPGAQLMLIEGMGHDLPHGGAWPKIAEAIAAHTLKAVP